MVNPLKITQSQFDQRWDELPETLRELLYSPEHAEIIQHICENYHLSEEKMGTVLGLVGSIIMGFLHIQDLDHHIAIQLDLNAELSKSIASEIRERALKRFEDEIEKIFQPSLPSELEERKIEKDSLDIDVIGKDFSGTNRIITIVPENEKKSEPVQGAPFILHEEKKQETASERKSILKSVSIPLGFFKSRNQATPVLSSSKPVRVGVEAPEKNEKRVVNYSELRTSLSPFDTGQSFLSVGDAPKEMPPAPIRVSPPITPAIPGPEKKPEALVASIQSTPIKVFKKPDIMGTIKKPEPKIEGNTIDLR
ncbi:MAG: hypothetical protein ABSE68_03120 [Minisyncoccia bacterium]